MPPASHYRMAKRKVSARTLTREERLALAPAIPKAAQFRYLRLMDAVTKRVQGAVVRHLFPALPRLLGTVGAVPERAPAPPPEVRQDGCSACGYRWSLEEFWYADLLRQDAWVPRGDAFYDQAMEDLQAEIDKITSGLEVPLTEVAREVVSNNMRESAKVLGGLDPKATGYEDRVRAFVRKNVGMIKTLQGQQLQRVEDAIVQAHQGATRVEQLQRTITDTFALPRAKAAVIARDQTLKLNSQITQERQKAVGVETYVWTTSRDERVRGNPMGLYPNSPSDHYRLDGTVQRWDKPPITNTATGQRNHPGEDFQCRCVAVPNVEQILNGDVTIPAAEPPPPPKTPAPRAPMGLFSSAAAPVANPTIRPAGKPTKAFSPASAQSVANQTSAPLPTGRGKPYVTIEHGPGGTKTITEHPSKKAAHEFGMAKRKAGADIYAWSVKDAEKFGHLTQPTAQAVQAEVRAQAAEPPPPPPLPEPLPTLPAVQPDAPVSAVAFQPPRPGVYLERATPAVPTKYQRAAQETAPREYQGAVTKALRAQGLEEAREGFEGKIGAGTTAKKEDKGWYGKTLREHGEMGRWVYEDPKPEDVARVAEALGYKGDLQKLAELPRAQYAATQEVLKRRMAEGSIPEIDKDGYVILFRGVGNESSLKATHGRLPALMSPAAQQQTGPLRVSHLSSWTSDRKIADDFAVQNGGMVVRQRVHYTQVYSQYEQSERASDGTFSEEKEWIVLFESKEIQVAGSEFSPNGLTAEDWADWLADRGETP